jgi:hypothetical protein
MSEHPTDIARGNHISRPSLACGDGFVAQRSSRRTMTWRMCERLLRATLVGLEESTLLPVLCGESLASCKAQVGFEVRLVFLLGLEDVQRLPVLRRSCVVRVDSLAQRGERTEEDVRTRVPEFDLVVEAGSALDTRELGHADHLGRRR